MTKAKVGALGAIGALLGVGAYGLLGAATTPIGTASELSGWPQGRADAPLCIYGRVSDGGLTCVALIGTQDGGDVLPIGVAPMWTDAGASWPGAITPIPGAAVVVTKNLQIGNISSTLMLDTRANVEGEPSMDLRTRYPDGGCFWYEPFSYINTGGIVEFNQVACDGSTEQTKAQFDPVAGWGFFTAVSFAGGLTTDSVFSVTNAEPMIRYNSTPNQTEIAAFHNDSATAAILLQDEYPSAGGGCGLYQDINGHNANEWRCTGSVAPGQTVPTCSAALEGAIVIKPRSGATPTKRCTCINTAGAFAWGSETLAAGAISLVTAGGSSTVCP